MPGKTKEKAARRSPAALARERLDGARHRLAVKEARKARLTQDLLTINASIEQLEAEVRYLAQNPYLKAAETTQPELPAADPEPADSTTVTPSGLHNSA